MKLVNINPQKALNKSFLKQRTLRSEIELFKVNLIRLLDKIDEIEREENQKNHIRDFLRESYYKDTNEINTKDNKDLVIHLGKSNKDKVGVIIEAKRPGNKTEMITINKPNSKALQELVLYYLRERIEEKNIDIKYLIATNVYEWYIFDAQYFEKLFARNRTFVKEYEQWRDGQKVTKDTNLFYNSIAKPFIDSLEDEIECIYFDIRAYDEILRNENKEDDKNLIALQKLLSPYFLLKEPFADDSNSLNEAFYKELLHLIGLEEAKEGTKNIIRRKEKDKQAGSLLENTINILLTEDSLFNLKDRTNFGENREEQLFGVALELCLTWINRILFLKLLEGQLIAYHKGNKDYRFLNTEMINDYDELYKLFHQVLARDINERISAVQAKYARVPYLNSSLFDISKLEQQTIKINSLDNSENIELINTTILKEEKRKRNKLPALEYLFKFLDAYDFSNDGGEDIAEDNKTLINASVLGKVFEKINGYKDGSIFTPGFITMYMSRQVLRSAVVQKFKEAVVSQAKYEFETLTDVYNAIGDIFTVQQANEIVNSLRICDPSVGSGHFLVSCLNELIVLKSELGILIDKNGKRLRDYEIVVENDELIISDEIGIFKYNFQNKESQRVQETIFNEKQTIIENCLFGVDINPNSVKICRLRLWIELLKSAYYKTEENINHTANNSISKAVFQTGGGIVLETLPNIDINIKCGNSLLSRFALDSDLKQALKNSRLNIQSYQLAVATYRNTKDKEVKREMEKLINSIKENFATEIKFNDKRFKKLSDLKNELFNYTNQDTVFDKTEKEKKIWNKKVNELSDAIKKQETLLEEINEGTIYKNAFEWRFEFPEVLNDNGDFVGFDVVIGNPPYISSKEILNKSFYKNYKVASDQFDYFSLFIELSTNILCNDGQNSLIIPDSFLARTSFMETRKFLYDNVNLYKIIQLDQVFSEANISSCLYFSTKTKNRCENIEFIKSKNHNGWFEGNYSTKYINYLTDEYINSYRLIFINEKEFELLKKIFKHTPISDFCELWRGEEIGRTSTDISAEHKENSINIIQGENISRYKIKGDKVYIPKDKIKKDIKRYQCEKIIIRQLGTKINATLSSNQEITLQSVYCMYSNNPLYSNKYLLGVINSSTINFLYHSLFADKQTFPRILLENIKKINVPLPDKKNSNIIISLVDQILQAKDEGRDSGSLERKIDRLVYQLYDLTEDEIKMVEGE